MDKKAKLGLSAYGLIGIVFSIIGAIFLTVGLCLWLIPTDSEAMLVGRIYTGLGSAFLVLGLVFLAAELVKRQQANKLLAVGKYVWGEVVDFTPNYNIRYNNRHPYIVMVRYQDARGTVHIFRSGNLYNYPDKSVIGRQVKVYIGDDSYKHYYVDLEGVLPKVIEH